MKRPALRGWTALALLASALTAGCSAGSMAGAEDGGNGDPPATATGDGGKAPDRMPTQDAGAPMQDAGTTGDEGDAGTADGASDPPAPSADAGAPVRTIVELDTQAPKQLNAGDTLRAECLAIDDAGEAELLAADAFELRFSPEEAAARTDTGEIVVQKATTLQVWCQASSLALVDSSPASVRVLAGEVAQVQTWVDGYLLRAGDTLEVGCRAFDAFQNPVEIAPTVRVSPSDGGSASGEGLFTFTRAGIYDVACEVAGAEGNPVAVEVRPSDPVSLTLGRLPDEPVYGLGSVVQLVTRATDAYGNEVPSAEVSLESDPVARGLGDTRMRFEQEGTFTVRASLADDPLVTASTTLTVNGLGPDLLCGGADGWLSDASSVVLPNDGQLLFEGRVSDANDVASITVNGEPATVDEEGRFTAPLTGRFGMNFVDLVAVDGFGAESTRVCSFLASRRYEPADALLAGAVTLGLGQQALDDGNGAGEIRSLNDLLHRALNSPALRNELHQALLNENPVKPRSCDQKVLGLCVFRSEIIYRDSQLNGPNSTRLTLIPGGLHARVELKDVRLKLRVNGTLDSTGWVTMDRITVDVDFDALLVDGRPSIRVRRNSVQVGVHGIDTNFSGVSGFFLDLVLRIARGTLRNAVRDLVRDWVRDNFNQILDGVLGGLDISSLGTSFRIPSLDGSRDIEVGFGLGFSHLDANRERMRFGIATRFSGPTAIALESPGVAIPDGGTLRAWEGSAPAEIAVQIGVINQALHTLWRAGMFEGNVASALGDDVGADGLQIGISAQLPPVAHLRGDGMAELGLGALRVSLTYPGLWDEPIDLTLGARASMRAQLDGEDLRFSDLVVEELLFSSPTTPLDSESREVLEDVLMSLVQSLVDSALNDAIPALPIPSFALPDSLTEFGLPAGARLGLIDRSLENSPPHFVLRGTFGTGG